jgi:mycothiol synthase
MIRAVESDADVALCGRIAGEVEQTAPTVEQLGAVRERLLLHPDGGYAYVDHSSVAGSAFAMVRVLPERRRSGIGSALVEAAAAAARELGCGSAWGCVHSGDEESLGFATRRGFEEVGREVELSRPLVPGEGEIPRGIVELGDEHRAGAYAVAVAAVRELAGAVAFVALEGGAVVGYATLEAPGDDPTRLEHGFTGVLPEYRRRGVATALGEAQIAWAAGHGYEALVTTTGFSNAALRGQKAKLGFDERPGPVLVRGPV